MSESTIGIPRDALTEALLTHLTGAVLENPESREELVRDFVKSVLSTKSDSFGSRDKSFVETWIRDGIASKVKEIAQEWITENQDLIKTQVAECLESGMVKAILEGYTTQMAEKIKRGF